LQQIYLEKIKKVDQNSFYNKFDLDNQWLFFCISVYNKLKELKNKKNIEKEDILKIIDAVKKRHIMLISDIKEATINLTDKIKKMPIIRNVVNRYSQLKEAILPAPKIDCVKNLFAEFMFILFQYEYDRDNVPIVINTSNVGDSTVLQEKFKEVVLQQSNYDFAKFDNDIKVSYLNAQVINETENNNTDAQINKLETQIKTLTAPKISGGSNITKTKRKHKRLRKLHLDRTSKKIKLL
jgi:hypothetical protein